MKALKVFGAVLLAVFLLYMFISIGIRRNKLSAHGKYTVGITLGRHGKFIDFKFYVNGKEFKNDNPVQKYNPEERDGKYFVKFLPSDPDVNEIFWDNPVSDCIGEPPADGWEEIPKCK
ncbi:MAG: hypothetical protein JST69_06495 [Bacteroidetes bacterium]|nr:hypothetical protein [Bacteroidota bacterium]